MNKQKEWGQFFTKSDTWLNEPIKEFINNKIQSNTVFLDPFAGAGDMLNTLHNEYKNIQTSGYDIDPQLPWKINDSLKAIPIENEQTIIVTNPPYLAKNKAKRNDMVNYSYFLKAKQNDLYKIALEQIIKLKIPAIVIIPRSFITSNFPKEKICSIIISNNDFFEDTTEPTCVICIDPDWFDSPRIFIENEYKGTLDSFSNLLQKATATTKMKFNAPNGQIGIRAFDSHSGNEPIQFINTTSINNKPIKSSNRNYSKIWIDMLKHSSKETIEEVIVQANKILNNWRKQTYSVLLTPFKGKDKKGNLRYRITFKQAREILKLALDRLKI